MELDLATARGGRHRMLRRGWLAYAMWVFAPLGLALVIAAITALPGPESGTPFAGGPASKLPAPPVPTPNGGVSPPSGAVATAAPTTSRPTRSPLPHRSTAAPTLFSLPAPTPISPTATSGPPPRTPTPVAAVSMEAEDAVLGSQLKTEEIAGASGGMVVTGLGKNSHRTLTLPEVTIAVSGYYRLDLVYAATEQIRIDVHTSVGADTSVSCPPTAAATLSWCATMVLLDSGPNTISVEGQQNNTDARLDLVILS